MKLINEYDKVKLHRLQIRNPSLFKDGYFLSIKYHRQPFYILTPKVLIPFGLNKYGPAGIAVSFDGMDFDAKIAQFYEFVLKVDNFFQKHYTTILQKIPLFGDNDDVSCLDYKNYKRNYISALKNADTNFPPLMTLKIIKNHNYKSTAYNDNKEELPLSEIKEKSYSILILHLAGIWIKINKETQEIVYGPQWNIVQMRVEPPQELKPFAILEDYSSGLKDVADANIQTTPPVFSQSILEQYNAKLPPPPPSKDFLLGKNKKSILEIIQENRGNKLFNKNKDGLPKVPSLFEIQNGLKNLKKHTPSSDSLNKKLRVSNSPMERLMIELKEKLAEKHYT